MSYRLMVVDDDCNTRTALATLMELEGYAVDIYSDGHSALGGLRAQTYGGLVTDYVMPGMDGLQLVRAARALQPEIRCYVLTGRPRPQESDSDPLVWLPKPVDIDILLQLLRPEHHGVQSV